MMRNPNTKRWVAWVLVAAMVLGLVATALSFLGQ